MEGVSIWGKGRIGNEHMTGNREFISYDGG